MAIYRANTNGSWTASSPYIWDIYDEQTDTWCPASSYPNSIMDDAYLNGFDVTSNNIYLKSLHNDANLDLGINAGGQLLVSGNVTRFTSDIFGSDIIRFTTNTGLNTIYVNGNLKLSGALFLGNIIGMNTPIVITGNVDMSDSHTYLYKSRGYSLTIIGNIILPQYYLYERDTAYTGYLTITINGNVTATTLSLGIANNNSGDITINGICNFLNSPSIFSTTTASVNVYGKLFTDHNLTINNLYATEIKSYNATISCNSLTINGTISYTSNNNSIGVKYNTINILNPDTFTWKDVTEPRSNPFIILTDAEMNNRQQYPSEYVVKQGVEYVWGEKVGTYEAPPESVVLKGYVYDNGDKIGSLENQNIVGCVTREDVREGVELIGLQEVGTLVVPSVDDVREGVVFDNGAVGTLIVEGGGDRLRIANFGYYTDSQSDTYIVDLTEQDKPKFAVAEERVLIEMFPDLDFDNIPEKYFDDLFVKYLKYRLIVEYYRTAGINSTFSTSEPTTEIVNYRNVNCEIWMNIANTYLKAWGEKYPNSIKKQRILL